MDNAVVGAAVLVAAVQIIEQEAEEYYQLMMAAARIAALEWMELEEGMAVDDLASWQHVTVNIDDYHNMNDRCFQLHFRMSKRVFQALVETIDEHLRATGRLRRERTPLRNIMLMVVWLLATPDTFRSVALRFGVCPSTLYYFYSYVIEALRELAGRYISWPGEEERQRIKETFQRATGFPGVVGCIDGTHVYVTAPVRNAAAHRNRHQTYSILVQAVVDSTLLVRDLYVGEPGSMTDKRVFRRSDLCRDILAGGRRGQDEHLVGDGGYTLTDFMLIPFANNGHLNEAQFNFNRTLSQCRVRVENAFGRAKGKWRRIKFMHVRNQEAAVDHITASFVLHNFTILQGEQLLEEDELMRPINDGEILGNEVFNDDEDEEAVAGLEDDLNPNHVLMEGAQARGQEKRMFIMEHLGNFQ